MTNKHSPWSAHEREIERVIDTKQPVQGEFSFQHKRLGHRIYEYNFTPVFDEKGEVEAVAGSIRDITEYKQTERALRESAEKYRTLFETMDEGFCIIKMEFEDNEPVSFRYLEINPAFRRHTGLEGIEIEGKSAEDVLPDVGEDLLQRNGRVALTGEPFNDEIYVEEVDRWLDLSTFRVGDPEDRTVAVLFNDITDRKANELANAYLGAIVDNSDDAIISKNLDGIITSWNNSASRIFGYTVEEAVGQPITIIIPDERIDEEDDIISRISRGEKIDHFETKRKRKDGSLIDVSLTISPIKNSEDNIVGASKIARDITKRKVAEKKLELMNETLEDRVKERTKKLRSYQRQLRSLASQLNKAEEQERKRLASELHGKLGQMLAIAKMKTDGLQYENLPNMLSRDLEELKQVIDDTLKYNQNLMLELMPPPMLDKEDVTEVILWVAKQVEKQGLNIDINNDGQPKPVDKELRTILYQSVRELLQNVLKHAEINEVRITVSTEQGDVKVTVEDKGKGFGLTDEAQAPTKNGGFGLFNIKERMDWHGGSFEIESVPGNGTKATLYAPLKEKEKRPLEEEIQPPSHKEEFQEKLEQKIKVLLVDDHKMMRRGLRQLIERENDLIVAEEASDGKEALELAHATSPHVIIMDVNMPVMDGIEATQKIRAEMPDVRVIGLSLHDSSEVINNMLSAGASDYLTKNEAFESLIATIRAGFQPQNQQKKG